MFSKHVAKDLSAYCHNELSADDSQRVAEHLIGCIECRLEFEEIKLGAKLAEQLPLLSAPESLWADIEVNIGAGTSRQHLPARQFSIFGLPRLAILATSFLVLIGIVATVLWLSRSPARPSWEVASIDGTPRIGSAAFGSKGRLGVGQWLETDGVSRAQIEVSSIGQVEIDPNTRVRLVNTQPTEHRLELARGRMTAHIWAPPRLFFVNTPSAIAADLGCAYTLEVDEQGGSLLRVTAGWVALQLKDRESMVPAGAACRTRPGIGPGTPYFEDASESFRSALARVDFDGPDANNDSLDTLLLQARARDSLTLWHLLFRVTDSERLRVYERLAMLSPPPDKVTREGALQLDQTMLDAWKQDLEKTWTNSTGGSLGYSLKKAWAAGLGRVNGLRGKK